MSELTSILVLHTGRPVIDSTKLTGVYNFSIELPVPPFVVQGLAAAGITAAVDGTPINMPSAASAVKGVEQLGLKLEPRRLPVDTIVVDKMERVPSDN